MLSNSRLNKWFWRVYPLWIVLTISFLLIVYRLIQLQISDEKYGNDFLKKQGEARIIRNEVIHASRGEIFDRNGKLLAFSSPVKTIWANPKLIDISKINFSKLSNILDLEADLLKNKLSQDSQFVYLRRQISPEKANIIMSEKIKAFFLKQNIKDFILLEKLSHI